MTAYVRGVWEYFEAIAGLSKKATGGKLEQWMPIMVLFWFMKAE